MDKKTKKKILGLEPILTFKAEDRTLIFVENSKYCGVVVNKGNRKTVLEIASGRKYDDLRKETIQYSNYQKQFRKTKRGNLNLVQATTRA